MNYVAIGKVTGVRHSIIPGSKREVSIDWLEDGKEDSFRLGHSFQLTDVDGIFNMGDDVEIRVTKLTLH